MRKKFSLNKLMKEFLKEKLETLEIKGVYVRSNPSQLKSETLDMIYEAIQTAPVVLNRKIIIKVKP